MDASLQNNLLTIEYSGERPDPQDLTAEFTEMGYSFSRDKQIVDTVEDESKWQKWALYLGSFSGIGNVVKLIVCSDCRSYFLTHL